MSRVLDEFTGNVNGTRLGWWQRWPEWGGYAASLWSLLYAFLGLYWTFGGAAFPFGEGDPDGELLSLFSDLPTETGAPLVAVLGLAGAGVGFAMSRGWAGRLLRWILPAFAWGIAAVLLLLVPDYRVLMNIAYMLLLQFGQLDWPVANQMLCILGGLLWALTAVVYARRTRQACLYCGRTAAGAGRLESLAAKWGKWATYLAVAVPVFYALTRWAWALGIPLGITRQLLQEGQAQGIWWFGAGLGTLAVGGAILTLGLIQHWGEVFPRWMPWLAGRAVPVGLAVIPASLVSGVVTSAGLMFVRLQLTGVLREIFGEENWAAVAPELLWPFWGIALAAAALAYYYRRRGRCSYCERS